MDTRCWPDEDEARLALSEGDGEGVKVAILDSGISLQHPALQGISLDDDVAIEAKSGKVMVEDARADDLNGHGTAVAYLVRQLAPRARIGNFRVLNARIGSDTPRICAGVRAAIQRGYQILNCSFGRRDETGEVIMAYKKWMDEAYLKRVHIVAACNNENCEIQEWPGFFPTCINVNMVRGDIGRCFYRDGLLVEFAAAGIDVRVPSLEGGFKTLTGSSFAAPQLSGYLARLLGRFPALSVLQAKALLQHIAEPWTADIAATSVSDHG